MKTIFIHVGLHKTASTLLQVVLFHFQPTLRERFSIVFDEVLGIKLSQKLRDGSPKAAELDSIRAYMKTEVLKRAETYVISNENLSGSPTSGYADTERIARDIKHLAQDFDQVSIIVFVRRQDTFLESLFHQQIKMGRHYTFREFLSTIDTHAFHWPRVLAVYENVFGKDNLTVFPFEALRINPNETVTRFLTVLGAPIAFEGNLPVSNPGLSRKGIELMRFGNTILNKEEKSRLRAFLEENFPKAKGEGFGLFTPDQRKRLMDGYRESNKELFGHYIMEDFKAMASLYF